MHRRRPTQLQRRRNDCDGPSKHPRSPAAQTEGGGEGGGGCKGFATRAVPCMQHRLGRGGVMHNTKDPTSLTNEMRMGIHK